MLQAHFGFMHTPSQKDATGAVVPLHLTREARLELIRERLDAGYYERADVARAVARHLLPSLLAKEPPNA